jgi:hypothetical protein
METGTQAQTTGYEFSSAQNDTIQMLGKRMKVLGWVYIVYGALIGLFGVLALVMLPLAGIIYLVITAVVLFTGIWTKSAATSFEMIVSSKGSDINHLMDALESLRKLYNLQYWLLIVSLIILVIGVIIALVVGIDAMSTMEEVTAT